jgi:hypothetical protein
MDDGGCNDRYTFGVADSGDRRFRIVGAIFVALFVFACVVQGNDPDPLRWAAFYAAAAVVTARVVWGRMTAVVPAVLGVLAVVWALTILPAATRASFPELFKTWRMMSPGMEEGRESLGLLIVAAWMFVLYRRARAREG